jgi:hypothetical protein
MVREQLHYKKLHMDTLFKQYYNTWHIRDKTDLCNGNGSVEKFL